GADIIAGVIATGLAREDKLRVFVDVGTNGEIVLGSAKRVLCTAAPAGPAFEGSQIRCGMRATDGAIEGVTLTDRVELQVIGGDIAPKGICGSGLVDTVAQLRVVGLAPPVDVDCILSVGNTVGEGAKMSLLSFRERQVAFELPDKMEYVELSGRPDFNDSFVSVLQFAELEALR